MEFYSEGELSTKTASILDNLSKNNDVVIIKNGKPSALMIGIPDGMFNETVRALREVKAIAAMKRMRNKAERIGFMSDEEIEAAINEARGV